MADFASFDTRGYRTVDVRTGYGQWVETYEGTVENAMDVELLESLESVDWSAARQVADLGCGTGRTGAWLASLRGRDDRRRRPHPADARARPRARHLSTSWWRRTSAAPASRRATTT